MSDVATIEQTEQATNEAPTPSELAPKMEVTGLELDPLAALAEMDAEDRKREQEREERKTALREAARRVYTDKIEATEKERDEKVATLQSQIDDLERQYEDRIDNIKAEAESRNVMLPGSKNRKTTTANADLTRLGKDAYTELMRHPNQPVKSRRLVALLECEHRELRNALAPYVESGKVEHDNSGKSQATYKAVVAMTMPNEAKELTHV